MPIEIQQRVITDSISAATSSLYKANAGDKKHITYSIYADIKLSTSQQNVTFTFDYNENKIFVNGANFLEEGFLVGDTAHYKVRLANGNIKNDNSGQPNDRQVTVLEVGNTFMKVSQLEPTIELSDRFEVFVKNRIRDGVKLYPNHAPSTQGFTQFSHIDGEPTQLKYEGISSETLGVPFALTKIGKQSGQFNIQSPSVTIVSVTHPANQATFCILEFDFDITQSGIYDDSPFQTGGQLQLSTGFFFYSTSATVNNGKLFFDEVQSDTGYFDEGYNSENADAKITTKATNLYYDNTNPSFNTWTAKIKKKNGSAVVTGYGASYNPKDPSYYKNQFENQTDLGFTVPTQAGTTLTGTNTQIISTPEYIVIIDSVTTVIKDVTVEGRFYVNNAFKDFMAAKSPDDRAMKIWVQIGNTNVLIFDDVLIAKPLVATGGIFENQRLNSNRENSIDPANPLAYSPTKNTPNKSLAHLLAITAYENDEIEEIRMQVLVDNGGAQEMVLQEEVFSLTNNPLINGQHVLNEVIPKDYNLATGNVKNNINIYTESVVTSQYTVNVHFPFLLDWRYWLPFPALPFYYDVSAPKGLAEGNKNWLPYAKKFTPPYKLTSKILFTYTDRIEFYEMPIDFVDYDTNSDINTTVELKRKSTGQVLQNIINNEIVTIEYTFTSVGGNWGATASQEITVEPFEGAPRWTVNRNIADTNSSNPLKIVSSSVVGAIAKIKAEFDPSKIDTSNGVTFTGEMIGESGGDTNRSERLKNTYTTIQLPDITGFDNEEDRGTRKCCAENLVMADLVSSSQSRNDKSLAFVKLASQADPITFRLMKGNEEANVQYSALFLPNDPNTAYIQIDWQQVLNDDGAGCYELYVEAEISGITFPFLYNRYVLQPFSQKLAKDTVKLRCTFDKYSMKDNVNFKDSEVVDDIRIRGEFGKYQPKQVINNQVYTDRNRRSRIREELAQYTLESGLLDPQTIRQLAEFHFINAGVIYVSDFGGYNPDQILNLPVVISEEGGGMVLDYYPRNRRRSFKCVFDSVNLNNKSSVK